MIGSCGHVGALPFSVAQQMVWQGCAKLVGMGCAAKERGIAGSEYTAQMGRY